MLSCPVQDLSRDHVKAWGQGQLWRNVGTGRPVYKEKTRFHTGPEGPGPFPLLLLPRFTQVAPKTNF